MFLVITEANGLDYSGQYHILLSRSKIEHRATDTVVHLLQHVMNEREQIVTFVLLRGTNPPRGITARDSKLLVNDSDETTSTSTRSVFDMSALPTRPQCPQLRPSP